MLGFSDTVEHARTHGEGYLEVGTKVMFEADLPDGSTEWIPGEIGGVVECMDISFYEVNDLFGEMHRVALRGVWIQKHWQA